MITEKEYNQIELSLDIVISKIDQFNPNFLHIIFGGNCSRGSIVQQLNCKKRRIFWPYENYYSEINSDLEFPRRTILIIDPNEDSSVDDFFTIDSDDSDGQDEYEINYNQANQIIQLNKWQFSKNFNCSLYTKLLNLINRVVNSKGIVSILDEIKAYESPNGPVPNYMIPFASKSLKSNSIIFISWQPRIPSSNADNLGNMGLILKSKPKDNNIPIIFNVVSQNPEEDKKMVHII